MNNSLFHKRIPTVFVIFIIAIGIGLMSYLVNTGVIFIGRASPGYAPENIRISNVFDTSFTVSYTTTDTALGSIAFGTNKDLESVALDDRSQQTGGAAQYHLHYITLRGLKPNTKYFYTIISGTTTFKNEDSPFEITTASAFKPQTEPIPGQVLEANGTIPKEAIVYLKTANAQLTSVLVKTDGTYILPVNQSAFTPETILQLEIIGKSEKSNVVFLAKQGGIPPITLSQNYDFTTPATTLATSSAELIGFPSFTASKTIESTGQTKIITPKREESFTDQQPLLKGSAAANTLVTITINSPQTIEAKVQTDSRGNWTYRPKTPLSPGKHTISITARDAKGIMKTITQTFTVYAAGTQIAQVGSNVPLSPAPTSSVRPTATPTITPTITTTPTPTIPLITPTPTPTLTPTPTVIPPTATPLPTIAPITKGQLPPPGNSSLMGIAIPAFITTAAGILLFILSRGAL